MQTRLRSARKSICARGWSRSGAEGADIVRCVLAGKRPATGSTARFGGCSVAAVKVVNEWIDAAGGFLRSSNWADDGGPGTGPLLAELQAISNAQLASSVQSAPRAPTTSAVAGVTWWLCTDTVVLAFACADGTNVAVTVPAPDESIFLPGRQVVDPANADIVAIAAAAVGVLTNPAGSAVTAFVSGVRSSRRTEQNAPPG